MIVISVSLFSSACGVSPRGVRAGRQLHGVVFELGVHAATIFALLRGLSAREITLTAQSARERRFVSITP
jgi:hypothetical protein